MGGHRGIFSGVSLLVSSVGRRMLKCFKVGFRGQRTCTVSCISRLLAMCGRAAKLSRASFISKHNREGDVQRGRYRRLGRCLRHLGSCTCRVRAYKRREGDCSGASRSTAFVHLGHSCVKGSRLLPTCGLRTTVYSRCVTMVSMGPCTSSVRYFMPLVRGFGHACNRCPGCPITSTKCNSCGGCLCYRRRKVRGCVGFAVCGGRAASGGCRRGPCHTMGFTGSTCLLEGEGIGAGGHRGQRLPRLTFLVLKACFATPFHCGDSEQTRSIQKASILHQPR